MESPQPSSPRLKVANNTRTHVTIVVESASGVLPTVPDNGGRHAMSRVDQHQEATASGTVSSGMPTSRTGADSTADQSICFFPILSVWILFASFLMNDMVDDNEIFMTYAICMIINPNEEIFMPLL